MPVTMKQIAQEAGVSRSAVSAVFNNDFRKIRVSEEKQEQIRKLIKRCHYRPNYAAQILNTRKTSIINIVIPSAIFFQNYNLSTIVAGLQSVAEQHCYRIKFTSLSYGFHDTRALDGIMADGIILFYWGVDHDRVVKEVQKLGLPLVVANARCHLPRVHNLYFDTRAAMYTMTRHLLDSGHRSIAYAPVFPYDVFNWDARSGVRRAMRECRGAKLVEYTMPEIPTSERALQIMCEAGRKAVQEITYREKVSAILFNQDTVAFGALQEAHQWGIGIPQDLAIASLGNDPYSAYWYPSLTTMDQQPFIYGRRLGAMLFDVMGKKRAKYRREKFDLKPLYRESTRTG